MLETRVGWVWGGKRIYSSEKREWMVVEGEVGCAGVRAAGFVAGHQGLPTDD